MTRTEIFQKLKAKRKEIANREGVELFMVFTNKALEETVKAMPASREDLVLVKGWGKAKIAKYGSEILDIINVAEVRLPDIIVRKSDFRNSQEAVFSVSEFLEAVNITLRRLGTVRIRGEVSEMRLRGSVVYFTLKDSNDEATVKCVLWASKYEREYDYLEDGMEIVIDAWSEVYAKFGAFNVRVERIEPVGAGALQKAFEMLKKKLETKGYFAEDRKRPLQHIIQCIGVITSEKGEAINDFLKNIGLFGFEIVIRDVRVEGDQAESSIVAAFREFNALRSDLDVLCLIRGGGGLENLKAFNTERVAEAVVSSRIPVLTGIGHERDVTIASLSSDADFSTPTKVADAIRRSREDLLRAIEKQNDMLIDRTEETLQETMRACSTLEADLKRMPDVLLERLRTRISAGAHQLQTALNKVFAAFRLVENAFAGALHILHARVQKIEHQCSLTAQRMGEAAERMFGLGDKRIAVLEAALSPLDPVSPLRRGYSIVYGANGKVVKRAQDVIVGEHVTLQLCEGSIRSKVEEKRNEKFKNQNAK